MFYKKNSGMNIEKVTHGWARESGRTFQITSWKWNYKYLLIFKQYQHIRDSRFVVKRKEVPIEKYHDTSIHFYFLINKVAFFKPKKYTEFKKIPKFYNKL